MPSSGRQLIAAAARQLRGSSSAHDAASARTGRSLSALIREAVEKVYGSERSAEDDLASMRRAFGSWKDRDRDGAAWVEERRSGSRLRQPLR
jgi:hypothetical protein